MEKDIKLLFNIVSELDALLDILFEPPDPKIPRTKIAAHNAKKVARLRDSVDKHLAEVKKRLESET
jgi:hypothetical protein